MSTYSISSSREQIAAKLNADTIGVDTKWDFAMSSKQ